jgi:myo-inositol catabolism protein IolC
MTEVTGPPSAAQPLFIMAMDQRDSFGTLFRVQGQPTGEQLAAMRGAKQLIFAGAQRASGMPLSGGRLGVLVDEQLGADVARHVREAGVDPGIWKLEGYETTEGARLVLDAVKSVGPPESACIMLGRNAPQHQVDHWLDIAAPLEGYVGFAVGRSNWRQPLIDYLAGHADRDETEARISEHYRHFRPHLPAGGLGSAGGGGEPVGAVRLHPPSADPGPGGDDPQGLCRSRSPGHSAARLDAPVAAGRGGRPAGGGLTVRAGGSRRQ